MGYYKLGEVNRRYLNDPNTQFQFNVDLATPLIVDAAGRELLFDTKNYIRVNRYFTAQEIERILGFPHPVFCSYTNDVVSNKSRGVVVDSIDKRKLDSQSDLETVSLYFIWSELNYDGNEIPRWTGGTESHWG